ncbi:MAG: gliding motility-associated C-terminal domain-containing protein [Saprospiraceae bacterium]|nr:gliding motility-associated C-terminal domain-containing protein [Saprospiraceae bacterium]
MMKVYSLLLSVLLLFIWNSRLGAQCNGAPCQIPVPEPNAQDACILPDPSYLDCYFGATFTSTPVSLPPSWCSTVENNHFFAFTADAATEIFDMCTYGCAQGGAIQAAVLSTADCINFQFVSPCLGNIQSGTCQDLIASNLVIGQTYYLMIDGSAGALCDYSINGVNPTINGPNSAPCLPSNLLSNYTTNTLSNWTIDPPTAGVIQGSANSVSNVAVQWLEPGPAQVCAQSIVCPNAPNLCIDIYIGEDVATQEDVSVCQGQTVECAGVNHSTAGNHFVTLDSWLGCDSVVNCFVTIIPTVQTNETHLMCQGGSATCAGEEFFMPGTFPVTLTAFQGCDSVVNCKINVVPTYFGPTKFVNLCHPASHQVCDEFYDQTGIYSTQCTGFLGCDSIVNVDLAILNPIAQIAPPAVLDCGPNAIITLNGTGSNVNNSTGGVTLYSWSGPGIIGPINQSTIQVNLPGQYCLILQHGRGGVYCADTTCVTVQASALTPGATATGGNINCVSPQVTLMGSSPTGGVNYTWTGPGITPANQFQQNPTVNQLGTYVLTVLNPTNGCTSSATVTVNGDTTPPTVSAVGDTITCFQTSVTIDGITNAPTAAWNWAGPGINAGNQMQENPNVLLSGTYTVTVTNTGNGCSSTATTSVTLNNANPTATAGPNDTLTCMAPNTTLQGAGNAGGQPITFSWTGPNNFMSNIAQPSVSDAGTYILTVLNTLNGCLKKDTVVISSNQVLPTANAGADSIITCAEPSVRLIGSTSSNGPNFTATWNGPGINAGNMNQYSPTVNQQGTYILLITNITSGCTDTDTVLVNINTSLPTADAGVDEQLTCGNPNGVVLNGSGAPVSITYFWTGPGIGVDNDTMQNPTVTQPGTYDLIVTNTINGCTATDQTIVTQDANIPNASAGGDRVLNCTVTSVNLNGSGSSSGAGIVYNWAGPGISGNNVTAQNPTNITVPGIYNLTVTNTNNNCENTDVMVVTLDTLHPLANAGNPLILNCFNNGIDTLRADGSNMGANFTLLWAGPGINAGNQNSSNPVINNAPGLYTLTVTNNLNTCTSTAQVNVTDDLVPPIADAGADQIIDCIAVNATIGGNSSSGAQFTYLWTGPDIDGTNQSLPTPTIDLPGTYTIVVTDNSNGCTSTNDVLVTTDAAYPTALAGNDGLLTCAAPTAILDGSASSSGANFQILWTGPGINAGNQGQPSPSVTIQGTYILQVTDTQNSCVTFDTVFVDENKVIPAADAGQSLILNCQITNVTLDGSLSGVSPTIVYVWAGPGITGANQSDQSPVIDQPGPYNLIVIDNENGCSATDQVMVTQDTAAPNASAGADGLITCAMLTQTIDGSGNSVGQFIEYIWVGPGINSGNFNLPSPTVSVSGTYTVTVTNTQNECTATDEVFINLNKTPPAIAAGPDGIITCAATTAQLDATQSASGPNISFLWGGAGILPGSQTSATPTVNLPGVYSLTLTDANNGCTSVEAVTVAIDTINPIVLAGSDMVITCANSGTGVTLSSLGSSVGTNFNYLWSGPGITATNDTVFNPTVLLPGTYTLLITNAINGCDQTDVVFVDSEQDLPTADAGNPQEITCAITQVTLDASGSSSPNGTLQYLWDGPGINLGNATDATPTVQVSGSYTLTVTDLGTGCSATDQVLVTLDNQPPAATASSTEITCTALQSTLSATSTLSGSTYFWTGPDVNPNDATLQTLQVSLAGTYNVTVTAPNGCTGTATTLVTQDANVPDGLVNGAVLNCLNGGVSQIGGEILSPSGATATWSGPGIVGTVNTLTVMVSQPGFYTFTISAPNGCVRPFTAEVVADFAQPTVIIAAPDELDCNTSEVTLNATGSNSGPNFTRTWSTPNGNFVSGTNTLSPIVDQAGDYQLVIVNNTNGCSATNQVDVFVDPAVPSAIDLTVRDIKCFGDVNGSITVNGVQGGTSPFVFLLSSNTGTADNQYTGLPAGQYMLSLADANGCQLDTVITINDAGDLLVSLGPDVKVDLGEYATVTAQITSTVGVETVTWNYAPGCTDSIPYCETFTYLPYDTYRHRIEVVDSNGCVARDEVIVVVRKNRQVYVPNIFNPNSAENYIVTVFAGIDVAKVNSFFIFDRWGDEVFEQLDFQPNDYTKGWDGRVRGQEAQLGVYVWYCEVEFIDGETKLFKGDVTLVR